MSATTQINFRIPTTIKSKAQKKSEELGVPLNVLVKQFLFQFANKDNIVQYQVSYDFDRIFDLARKEGLCSESGKNSVNKMNNTLRSTGIL